MLNRFLCWFVGHKWLTAGSGLAFCARCLVTNWIIAPAGGTAVVTPGKSPEFIPPADLPEEERARQIKEHEKKEAEKLLYHSS